MHKNRLQKNRKFKDCPEDIERNILKGWFWLQDECTPVKIIFTVLIWRIFVGSESNQTLKIISVHSRTYLGGTFKWT